MIKKVMSRKIKTNIMIFVFLTGLFTLLSALSSPLYAQEFKTTTYYHIDVLGTPVAATNDDRDVLWRNFNSPYGVRYTKPNLDTAVSSSGVNLDSTGESTSEPIVSASLDTLKTG